MSGFMNLGNPENLRLFLEQETATFYQHQTLGYPWNYSPTLIPGLTMPGFTVLFYFVSGTKRVM